MKSVRILLAVLAALMAFPPAYAQDTETAETKIKKADHVEVKDKNGQDLAATIGEKYAQVPLKIQVVITEFDGTQKISSLPYTLYTVATGFQNRRGRDNLRFGVRVPIATDSSGKISYEDVGTNIDCGAIMLSDAQYSMEFVVDRSSIVNPSTGKEIDWKAGQANVGTPPMLRQFRDQFVVVMRDGQTTEGVSAADPATGHLLKVEVTLNVVK
jgi:hypothetical protein